MSESAASTRHRQFLPISLLLVGIISAVNCFAQPAYSHPLQKDTSQRRITFRLKDHPKAKSVALAGTFNNWNIQSTPLTRKGEDWSVSIHLAPGTYQYKFVVDQDRWIVDPENPQTADDGEGHTNSLLIVGAGKTAASLKLDTLRLKQTSFHRRVDVGGYKLYINCVGRARRLDPVIVMDAGRRKLVGELAWHSTEGGGVCARLYLRSGGTREQRSVNTHPDPYADRCGHA